MPEFARGRRDVAITPRVVILLFRLHDIFYEPCRAPTSPRGHALLTPPPDMAFRAGVSPDEHVLRYAARDVTRFFRTCPAQDI